MDHFSSAKEILARKYPRVTEALKERRPKGKNPAHHHCACGYWATSPGVVWDHIHKWEKKGERRHRILGFGEQPCE